MRVLSLFLAFCFIISFAFGEDRLKIQVGFSVDTPRGRYTDNLYFTQEEYKNITQQEIDAMKQARVNKWLAHVSQQPSGPTKEQQLDWLLADLSNIDEIFNRLSDSLTRGELKQIKADLNNKINRINKKLR